MMASRKIRILLVAHNVMGYPGAGGIEQYLDWIKSHLSTDAEFLFWVPDALLGPMGSVVQLLDSRYRCLESRYFATRIDGGWLDEPQRREAFADIIKKYAIDVVHFHHLQGHVPSLLAVPTQLGVPSLVSIHDFNVLCLHAHLQNPEGKWCGLGVRPVDCDRCLKLVDDVDPGSQLVRRKYLETLLQAVPRIHVPSAFVQLWLQTQMQILDPACFVSRGLPSPQATGMASKDRVVSVPLRVVVAGHMTKAKGGQLLLAVMRALNNRRFHFSIWGDVASEFLLDLRALEHCQLMGAYDARQLGDVFSGADVSLHASVVPETFSLSLSEAWNYGVVPIATRLGAFAERIENGENGFLVSHEDPRDFIEVLEHLSANPKKLREMRVALTDRTAKETPESHRQWLLGIYSGLAGIRGKTVSCDDVPLKWAAKTMKVDSFEYMRRLKEWPLRSDWVRRAIRAIRSARARQR